MPNGKRADMPDGRENERANANSAAHDTKQTRRKGKRPPPPPETIRAIEEQTTAELWQQLRRHAKRRVQRLRAVGIPVSSRSSADLVADAYADTWTGKLDWNPATCSLLTHLRSAIKKTVYRQIRRATKVSIISLSRTAANDEALSDIERALRDTPRACCPTKLYEMSTAIYQDLFRALAHDDDAIAVLRCWEEGIIDRAAIVERAKLADDEAYYLARRRLIRAGRALPSELREATQDLLRNAS